jgi:hypothetical protein
MTALENDKNKYNIVGLKNDSVYGSVKLFLDNKEKKSSNTTKTYEPTIHQFFTYCFGKDINEVTWDQVKLIKLSDCICFRDYLSQSYSNNTVNQKMGHN